MKVAIFCVIAVVVAWKTEEELIKEHNAIDGSSWIAGKSKFSELSHEAFVAMLGTSIKYRGAVVDATPAVGVPVSYDPRTDSTKPECFKGDYGVHDQAQCGSCWAFGGTEALSDRFCLAGCGKGQLSEQDLVSCDYMDDGCDGGNLDSEWSWMKSKGVTTAACIPYTSGGGIVEACPKKCKNGDTIVRYKATSYTHIAATVAAIQNEIYSHGPVEVAFDVYEDFQVYRSGVYQHSPSSPYEGGHAVLMIGWGSVSGKDYWIVQNSWNTDWGMSGYFWILRGKNECNIESNAYAPTVAC